MTTPTDPDRHPTCPSCDAPLEPKAHFCTSCGAAVSEPKRGFGVLVALLAALAAAVIVVGAMVWGSGDDNDVGEGPSVVAEPVPTTAPATEAASATIAATTTSPAEAPSTEASTATTTAAVAATEAPAPTEIPTSAPSSTEGPGAIDASEPRFFPTPEEAIADHLSEVDPLYAGPCDSLGGREADLGGLVTCSVLDQDLQPQQIHRWGVFATDDLRGWLFLDVGSAGWSVADESFEGRPPKSWTRNT